LRAFFSKYKQSLNVPAAVETGDLSFNDLPMAAASSKLV
jgi:hypothetical protein